MLVFLQNQDAPDALESFLDSDIFSVYEMAGGKL